LTALALGTLASPSEGYVKRFNCGGPPYTDGQGRVFVHDDTYTVQNGAGRVDGHDLPTPSWKPVGGTTDQPLFIWLTHLWTQYKFDVPNGSYLVRLRFADILSHGPGQRVQDIRLEGTLILNDFDIYAVAGDHYMLSYTFPVQVNDGQLNLTATIVRANTQISTIEVWDASPDTTPPATPAEVTIASSFGRMQLDWQDNVEDDLTGYYLERATSPSGPWLRLSSTPIRRSRADDATALPTVGYSYRVIAVDAFENESAPSALAGGSIRPDTATDMPFYQITISAANWATLNGEIESDNYVSGSFSYNGQTWNNVGLRYRGRTSRQVSKKNWKVKFDEFVNGQEFVNGWNELNLNSHFGERTMLRNSLAWELSRRAGVETAESGHVLLKVNGEYFGVYDSIEPIDNRWLSDHGYPPGGSLYRAEVSARLEVLPDTTDYMAAYDKKTNESTGYADLIQFIELINATPQGQIWDALRSKFDLESFIHYKAAMVALGNDSFFTHNYYVYHDLVGDRWYWLPWDLDSTFGHRGIFEQVVFPLTPVLQGAENVLINKLQSVPHFRRRFLERSLEIMAEDLTPAAFDAAIDSAWGYMQDEARIDWRKWGWEDPTWIDGAAAEIKGFIPDRQAYIQASAPTFMPPQDLFINEILADNDGGYQDEAGEFEDWVELYNQGTTAAHLMGCFLTDDITQPTKWAVPDTTIPPGGYILFWCDEEPGEGPTHTNFRLDKNGDWIGLYGGASQPPIDSKGFGNQIKDVSLGRFANGNWNWIFMGTPTPEASNLGQGNLPPTITDVDHSPASPGLNVAVQITARIVDGGSVASAKVFYQPESVFLETTMRDDGQGGDQSAGDDVWTATVPGQPQAGVVHYYILAADNLGREATDPVDAPLETHVYTVGFVPPPLKVNEFVAQNTTGIVDEFGQHEDWVEIWNAGPSPVSLLGLRLTDNLSNPDKFVFPDTTLPSHEFILVFCDNDPEQGPLHADFRLAASGEQVGLFASDVAGFAVIDTVTFGPQTANIAWGQYPDGELPWRFLAPTPNASNLGGVGIGDQPPGAAPLRLVLGPGRPNPARGAAVIPFGLPTRGHARLVIYDAAGRAVAELVDQVLEPGFHTAAWDGRALVGTRRRSAPAGVYFYRLEFEGQAQTGKVTLVR